MNQNLIIILTAFIFLVMATVVCNSVDDDGTKLPTPVPVTVVVATVESNWPDEWDGPLPEIEVRKD